MKTLNQIQVEERAKAIVLMIARGLSLQDVADIFRVSKSLVQQIYDAYGKAGKGRYGEKNRQENGRAS